MSPENKTILGVFMTDSNGAPRGLFGWQIRRTNGDPPPVKRLWAHDVHVGSLALQAKLNAIRAGGDLTPPVEAIADGVQCHLDAARNATTRREPIPGRASNWWRGTLVESAYQNLHAAEALIALLYDPVTVEAEIPEAVARVEAGLDRDDPRFAAALALQAPASAPSRRARLSKNIEVGFGAADVEHSRLRSFRNSVVGSTGLLVVFLGLFVWYVVEQPTDVPFCFEPSTGGDAVCPSGGSTPSWHDIVGISLLGMLGGVLSAIVSIRNLQGTSIAYDVPQALALLRVPLGALSAVGGILIIRGEFVPGLTALDSQDQILAYAFAFGFAQQLLVRVLDKQAQVLLSDAPGKAKQSALPQPVTPAQGATGSAAVTS